MWSIIRAIFITLFWVSVTCLVGVVLWLCAMIIVPIICFVVFVACVYLLYLVVRESDNKDIP